MTQALFDLGYLDRFLERLGGESPIPLLVGRLAADELPARVPPPQRGAGDHDPGGRAGAAGRAGADARVVGFELARQLAEGARTRAAGIYVIPPFKEPDAALELLVA